MTSRSNALSLDEHAKLIRDADTQIRNGVLLKADRIVSALEQLGEDTAESLATASGTNSSTLSRLRAIGQSEVIQRNRGKVPSSVDALYHMTLLRKEYEQQFGKGQGDIRIQKLLDADKLGSSSTALHVKSLLDKQKGLAKKKKQRQIAKGLKGLQPSKSVPHPTTLSDFIDAGSLFRTIVVIPQKAQIEEWKRADFAVEIGDTYPIHNLRELTQNGTTLCLLVCTTTLLDLGIRCLEGWGFAFRDVLVPTSFESVMVLIGSRGRIGRISEKVQSARLEDVLKCAEKMGATPRILLGESTTRKGWSVANG